VLVEVVLKVLFCYYECGDVVCDLCVLSKVGWVVVCCSLG